MRQRDALSFTLLPCFLLLVIGLGPLLAASYGSFFQLSQKPIFHWLLRTLFFCGVLFITSFSVLYAADGPLYDHTAYTEVCI